MIESECCIITQFQYFIHVLSHFSHVRLCVTLWTEALQAPLSMGFSRQEYWSGLPFPSPIIYTHDTNTTTGNMIVLKRWEYQTTLPASWKICMQGKKQQLEQDMEQRTGSKLGTEYGKAVYCHPAYLTFMQSTSCEMPGWIKHKLESRLGEMSITSDMQITHHPCDRKWRGTKETLDEGEREWKSWLKTQHSKNKDHGNWSYHFMANR